jgi:CRISPR-associated endonuclease Csy4
MKSYIDITLLPCDDIGHHFLWGKVYQQVHLALVENKQANGLSSVGVAFPEFNAEHHRLGRKLRLFAPDPTCLEKLEIQRWLERLHDYVHITHIKDVPSGINTYLKFHRLQTKSSKERLARRAAKRQSISYEKALEERKDFQPQISDLPFIQIKSLGNENSFRLFISMDEVETPPDEKGHFSTYGLSKGGVLPKF